MFQTKFVEKIKTHILCSATFLFKILPLMRKLEKYCIAEQATDDNMVRAHYVHTGNLRLQTHTQFV
jgi:hypothetical protein